MTKQPIPVHKGGCHCGSVRYKATGKPVIIAHCHCEDCQRLSGTGHSTGAMFAVENFQLDGRVSEYALDCGSQILGRNSGSTGYVTVSLGTLDDSSALEPQVTIFARNRKPWDIMDEKIASFDGQPDWKPDGG